MSKLTFKKDKPVVSAREDFLKTGSLEQRAAAERNVENIQRQPESWQNQVGSGIFS
jgi:hypothetical protein